ncbi:MAG: alpha/beta hydrolase [Planctomycetota bacterium]|nr:alpha/beta hydrolase [Planctomycetota bacterium]
MVTTDGTPFDPLSLNVYQGHQTGPPLVFVHGVLRCWQDFRPLFPYLGYDWTCVALDQRGHGESERVPKQYEVMHYVGDVVQFVESQFEQPVILYGHSLGAMVVAAVAAELGNKIGGAILEDPPFETMGSRIQETPLLSYFNGIRDVVHAHREPWAIASALAEVKIVDPVSGVIQKLSDIRDEASLIFAAKCLAKIDPGVLDPIVESRWLRNYDFQQVTQMIECPMLVLQGDPNAGGMLTDEDVSIMKSLKPNLFHVKFHGGGHQLHWTRREELINAVTSFLVTP